MVKAGGAGEGRNTTWREQQKRQFGERLKQARIQAGYRSAADAIAAMAELNPDFMPRSYYHYEAGIRIPDDDRVISFLAEMFGVTREFLLFGALGDVGDAVLNVNLSQINQPHEKLHIIPSQAGITRYIPIVTATDIQSFIETGRLAAMSGERLPVPVAAAAGPRAFYWRIPDGDHSMIGPQPPAFMPGGVIMFDPDRLITPGDFLLAWSSGAALFRRLDGAHAFLADKPVFPFTLSALNAHSPVVRVIRSRMCRILGRMIASTQIW